MGKADGHDDHQADAQGRVGCQGEQVLLRGRIQFEARPGHQHSEYPCGGDPAETSGAETNTIGLVPRDAYVVHSFVTLVILEHSAAASQPPVRGIKSSSIAQYSPITAPVSSGRVCTIVRECGGWRFSAPPR
jgi:hypothetical protein